MYVSSITRELNLKKCLWPSCYIIKFKAICLSWSVYNQKLNIFAIVGIAKESVKEQDVSCL